MPVYNCAPFIQEAIKSVLEQSFTDFELVISNDGSSDNTSLLIREFKDSRIKLIENNKNHGLVYNLNHCLDVARGEYIIRMDGDDISLPGRFEKLVKFMDDNPDIGVASSWLERFGDKNDVWKTFISDNEIKAGLIFSSTIAHAPSIIRLKLLNQNKIRYNNNFPHMEDYVLWHDLKNKTKFATIPEILYKYRITGSNVTEKNRASYFDRVSEYYKIVLAELKLFPGENEMKLHFGPKYFRCSRKNISAYRNWLFKLKSANKANSIYPEKELEYLISQKWKNLFYYIPQKKLFLYLYYWLAGKRIYKGQIRYMISGLFRKA